MCSIMNDMIQILVMLDLTAAFDTMVHKYLLSDLKFIGIDGSAYRWFESYLQNREVTVVVSQSKSETRKLTKGVPQGSVLGHTLFTIYTIELLWILKTHNVTYKLYADDTQFYFLITTIQSTTSRIEKVMTDIKNWMVKKRLELNDDKTECILFGTENTLKNYEQFRHIMIGTSNIKIVPQYQYYET